MSLLDRFRPRKRLEEAVRKNDVPTAQQVIAKNPELLADGALLDMACSWNRELIAEAMLKAGTKLAEGQLNVLLGSAANSRRDAIVKLLLDHGADVNADNGAPLRRAADHGYGTTIELLIARGSKTFPRAMGMVLRSSVPAAEKTRAVRALYATRKTWPAPMGLACTTCTAETLPTDRFESACAAEGLKLVNGNLYGSRGDQGSIDKYQALEDRKAFQCRGCGAIFCMSCLLAGAEGHPSGGKQCVLCSQRLGKLETLARAAAPAPSTIPAGVATGPNAELTLDANQLLRYRATSKAKADAQIAYSEALLKRAGAPKVRIVLFRCSDQGDEFPWLVLKAGTFDTINSYYGSDSESQRTFTELFGDQPRSIVWADHIAENCPRPGEAVTENGKRVYAKLIDDIRSGRYVVDRVVCN